MAPTPRGTAHGALHPMRSSAAIPAPNAQRAPQVQQTPPGWFAAQVVGRAQAAQDAITIWLALPGSQRPPVPYRPGQFITLALPSPRGLIYRSYSLCGDGSPDSPWEITIKRQEGGAASNYLYANAQIGATFQCSAPLGSFTLPSRLAPGSTLVFVATGSGITPIMGMLRALAKVAPSLRLQVQLHYAYRSPDDAIYGRALSTLDPQRQWLTQWHYISSHGNRMSAERILASVGHSTSTAHWFVCGSDRLKRTMEHLLLQRGVPVAQFHSESFGEMRRESAASIRLSAIPSATVRVRLAESGAVLTASSHETLLEALERNGYRPPFNCRTGICATCKLRLVAGQVNRGADSGLTQAQRAAGEVLSCVARPLGDVTIAGAGRKVAAAAALPSPQAPVARPRKALRWALVAASLAVFTGAWMLTNHKPTASAASTTTTTSGSSTSSGSSNGSNGSNTTPSGSSTSSSSNSGSNTGATNQATPNTNTGVS